MRACLLLLCACAGSRAIPPRHATTGRGHDVNGDGHADVASGGVLYWGGPDGFSARRTSELPARAPAMWVSSVVVGDVNGDGFADVLLGDPDCPPYARDLPECGLGSVTVLFGGADAPRPGPRYDAPSGQTDTGFGMVVSGIGDVNGDGRADGAALDRLGVNVLYGAPDGLAVATLASVPEGVSSVVGVGDVNGDGFGDAVLVAFHGSSLLRGGADGLTMARAIPLVLPQEPHLYFTYDTVAAGDFDGDGYVDLAMGMEVADDRANGWVPRRVVVLRGGPDGPGAPATPFTRDDAQAGFGVFMAGVGDLDGDGRDDLVIDSACGVRDDGGGCTAGRIHVYLGGKDGLAAEPIASLAPERKMFAMVSTQLLPAGDVDADGRPDFLFAGFLFRGAKGGLASLEPPSL